MKRLFVHLLQILLGGIVLFALLQIPLYDIPYLQTTMSILILLLCSVWGYLFFKRALQTPKQGKKTGLLLILGIVLFSCQLQAAEYCSLAEKYHQESFDRKMQNWQEDQPCNPNQWNKVRRVLNKLRKTPRVFTPSDKLTAAQQRTWRSFRQDSHWVQWVAINYADLGMDAEEMACAAVYSSLCSEYERRHPDTRAKTVADIMKKDAKMSGCWPCQMAYITLTVVQGMSSDLEENMRVSGLDILKTFMLLWILYAVFMAVVFPSKAAGFLKEFLYRLLCVMVAAMILSSGDTLHDLYRSVLSPIVGLGLGLNEDVAKAITTATFAQEVRSELGIDSLERDYCKISFTESSDTENNAFVQMRNTLSPNLGTTYPKLQTSQNALITPELEANLLCMTQKLYRQVSPITAVGHSLVSFSFADGFHFKGMSFPKQNLFWTGLVLIAFFSIFGFLVAFKIIDIFLRLGFVVVLVPLFVATWAFPLTRNFTKKGFKFFMGIITEFFGLVLALNFIIITFEQGIINEKSALIKAMKAPYSKEYGNHLYDVVTSGGGCYLLIMLVALFFIGTQLLLVCSKIISSFFGVSDAAGLGGDIAGGAAVALLQQTQQKLWKPAVEISKNAKAYEVENGKNAAYLAGRTVGRIKAGENPFKSETPAAPKRYWGEHFGNGVKRKSQYLAAGIDKVGMGVGQWLSKTGVGAAVGVPLTAGTKALSLGVRAIGQVGSLGVKSFGGTAHGVKVAYQGARRLAQDPKAALKSAGKKIGNGIKGSFKAAGKGVKNAVTAPFKKFGQEFKRGVSDGKK